MPKYLIAPVIFRPILQRVLCSTFIIGECLIWFLGRPDDDGTSSTPFWKIDTIPDGIDEDGRLNTKRWHLKRALYCNDILWIQSLTYTLMIDTWIQLVCFPTRLRIQCTNSTITIVQTHA